MFLFYVFSLTISENRRARQVLSRVGRVLRWWEGRGGRERDRRMNTVQIMYAHVHKCKNDTC
jgi:hypothetical protein